MLSYDELYYCSSQDYEYEYNHQGVRRLLGRKVPQRSRFVTTEYCTTCCGEQDFAQQTKRELRKECFEHCLQYASLIRNDADDRVG